jgi:AmmeMemoRadiSam system protein A
VSGVSPGATAGATPDLPQLARWARASVRHALGGPRAEGPRAAWAEQPAATFVTLRWARDGRLQGCIGSIEPRRALAADVAHNAVAAALSDPRALPLRGCDQVDELDVEVSLLSPLVPFAVASAEEAAAALRPGVDGVVLAWRGRRATLLPSVWERLETGEAFLDALRDKAGMPEGAWHGVTLWRYTVDKHVDRAPAARPS